MRTMMPKKTERIGTSEPPVHLVCGQDGLDVVEDGFWFAQGAKTGGTHIDDLAVGDGEGSCCIVG